jgi:hypothetical protein
MVMEIVATEERKVLRRGRQRSTVEALTRAARFLGPPECDLIREYYLRRRDRVELAAEYGLTAAALHRRMVMLRRRVSDPCFLLTIQFSRKLPFLLAEIAREHFRRGIPLAHIAADRGVTVHVVRKQVVMARALLIAAASRRYGGGNAHATRFVAALLGGRRTSSAGRPGDAGGLPEIVGKTPACVGG